MQDEFIRNYPSLDISIVGINEVGFSPTGFITDGRDLPWLVDVDANRNGQSDVWYDSWHITFRDVVILDSANDEVATYNLTVHSLSDPENYEALQTLFLNAAATDPDSAWQSPLEPLDINADGTIAPLDALLVINELGVHPGGVLPSGMADQAPFVDPSGDGLVSPLDALSVINHLNFLSSLNQRAPLNAAAVDTALQTSLESDWRPLELEEEQDETPRVESSMPLATDLPDQYS